MNKVRVSYLLATYNRDKFLENAFDNFRNFIDPLFDEFIIIDGGSTDKTLEIIDNNRDLITTLISEPDLGEAHAFNKGLLIAKGEIVKFLTDDDVFYPLAIKESVNYLLNHEDLDAIMCAGRFLVQTNSKEFVSDIQSFPNNIEYSIKNAIKYGNCGLGLFVRRRIFPLVGLFDTTFTSVDNEFILRLIDRKAVIKFFHIHLFDHFSHLDSSGKRLKRKIRTDWYRLFLRYRLFGDLIVMWARWNIRPSIPPPFRYLWGNKQKRLIEEDWNDGRLK